MSTVCQNAVGGFVRMPCEWLKLPISPQAKTLLMALCNYADAQGKSWCSYEQLGEILQRSKASVTTYVSELREHGLITCKRQTYGNGYNYRLLITLVGWKDILTAWSGLAAAKRERSRARSDASAGAERCEDADEALSQSAPPPEKRRAASPQRIERSVQRTECSNPSGYKNKLHKTHSARPQAAPVGWSDEDEDFWKRFRPSDRDPIGSMLEKPKQELLRKVMARSDALRAEIALLTSAEASDLAKAALKGFVSRRRLAANEGEIEDAAKALAGAALTENAIEAAIDALDSAWKPYWKRLSSPKQLLEAVKEPVAKAMPSEHQRMILGRFSGRAYVASIHLRKLETGDL
jgi:biotin operon repressor